MSIDLYALHAFRTANLGGNDAIANVTSLDKVVKKNDYHGALGKIFRGTPTKAANNAARTELLRALGIAFNVSGMSVSGDDKVHFSKAFMDKLEEHLGPAFKRGDFGIGSDGTVNSGKPLTQRRIKAIVAQAESVAKGQDVDALTLGRNGGVRKDSVYAPYAEKLATIKAEVAGAGDKVVAFFDRIGTTLDFLYNEIDLERGDGHDPSVLRNDQNEDYERELGNYPADRPGHFEYYDDKTGAFVPLKDVNAYRDGHLWKKLGGATLHLERAHFGVGSSSTITPLKKYIVDNLWLLVKKSIDNYFAAKETGKMPEFLKRAESPGACIEDQGLHMVEFEGKHLVKGDAVPEEEQVKLKRIAEDDAEKLENPAADKSITDILNDPANAKLIEEKDEWDDELAGLVKAQLLGKTATIPTYNEKTHKFQPLLVDGKPVVRPLTAEDIDAIGAKVFQEVFMG